MKILYLFLLSCFAACVLHAEGLFFRSYEVDKDSRTTLNLSPDRAFSFPKGFTLDFDIKLRREVHNFGYIFRLIIHDKLNLDLIVRATPPNRMYFLVAGNENRLTFSGKNSPTDDVAWTPVTVRYTKDTDELALTIDGTEQTTKLNGLFPSLDRVEIVFGETLHSLFATTDVAPMILRNIRLSAPGSTGYRWELGKHGRDEVFDENHSRRAVAIHPVWLIDRKATWKKEATLTTPQRHFWTFDAAHSVLYLAGPESLYVYDTGRRTFTDTVVYAHGSCFYSNAAQLLYDPATGRLLSYEIDSAGIECFDFARRSWKKTHTAFSTPDYWHHNRFVSTRDSSLYCFGGYGHHRYKSMLKRYSFRTGQWSENDLGPSVAPRYLAALGQGVEKIYLFGGYGSKTGEQAVSPRYFYDLYELDPAGRQVKKKWEYENIGAGFVQSNSMIVNEQENCFYTLCYSSEKYHSCIYLNRFSLGTPYRTVLADSIPFLFNDTESMCDLFLDRKNSRLVALTLSPGIRQPYEINIYTLAYPPLPASGVFQEPPVPNRWYRWAKWLLAAFTIGGLLYIRYKRKREAIAKYPLETSPAPGCRPEQSARPAAREKKESSISLLGGFQVIDREGKDMTGAFTPTLKNLLVLILLTTLVKSKGVSSAILIERFWYDKNESSARNNLSVNIKRLRFLLERIGGVRVIHSNGYWTIDLPPGVTCDYKEARELLENIRNRSFAYSENETDRLLRQLEYGVLLPGIQSEWIDEYKSEYTNKCIDALREMLRQELSPVPAELRCRICDSILMFDPLDEEAILDKCKVLYRLGKKGQAKSAYDRYCKNYSVFLNTEFQVPFSRIVRKE